MSGSGSRPMAACTRAAIGSVSCPVPQPRSMARSAPVSPNAATSVSITAAG
ncbi:MAG TPA: hypothetical protein VHZ33_20795 [Trebonia sp.]|nr:hypothetical protein [Trebonia sp.]